MTAATTLPDEFIGKRIRVVTTAAGDGSVHAEHGVLASCDDTWLFMRNDEGSPFVVALHNVVSVHHSPGDADYPDDRSLGAGQAVSVSDVRGARVY